MIPGTPAERVDVTLSTSVFAADRFALQTMHACGAYDPAYGPWPAVDLADMSPQALVELAALLLGASDAVAAVVGTPVEPLDDGHDAAFALDPRVVSALAVADPSVADAWVRTQELARDGWDAAAARTVLAALSALAARATSEQTLYLRLTLSD